ncbi:unnamed protein product [Allacma fusca]|uniref:Uncharacterized protein n=1 Tax=Allacma fusca TaxID=39272 RepID=A0A8J2PS48_9HEXA|nr:unnamed protein product [Allacma fusca]
MYTHFISVLFCVLFLIKNGLAREWRNPSEDLILIGNTSTKEIYMTEAVIADFPTALRHVCKNIFNGLELIAVESEDELKLIDDWFTAQNKNVSSGDVIWTSGFQFGDSALIWATGGKNFDLINSVTTYPNPAAAVSPEYSWYGCLGLFQNCNRPPGSSPGCYPLRAEFIYEDCRRERRVICQKRI